DMPSFDTLISRFDRRFENYGYSSHNLGDAVAGNLIISWEILHNADASETPVGIRRVRETVCQVIEKRGKATQLSSDLKQGYSDRFKALAELCRERIKRLQQANNVAAEQQLKNQIAQAWLKEGIDVRRYRLTNQGFING
ncbi:MAG: hypothetical protein JO170_21415, partial [Verrucomicrobia bacterium]|nr:hypothetical protein [Verrucomicrobiota bacterium]